MTKAIIRAEGLGKRYRIGERQRYFALRDVLSSFLKAPACMFQSSSTSSSNGRPRYTWAVRDVSFEVRDGEVVGLIGRNGAGKTTLLKILAKVTKPTEGQAEVRGRMGTLLEVGTGFHPELTGRENVFLSGAILGMGKREIEAKFDEMVAFAGVEEYIDAPLKHYSIGMQMRLAFAVAAHLEPEILLVDEVLAVGDVEFQKKCLGKMSQVAEGGRTILFVSHQMNQIRRLCQRVLWIDSGRIRSDGPARLVVNEYEAACLNSDGNDATDRRGTITFHRWQVVESQSNVMDLDQTCEKTVINIYAKVNAPIRKGVYIIGLRDANNVMVWSNQYHDVALDPGATVIAHEFARPPLNPGVYIWEIYLYDGEKWLHDVLVPELSIISKNDSQVLGHLKGFLNLESSFRVERGPERASVLRDPGPIENSF
jgi:ABC-type polysaccharide/polyol phosphate transport system ATPase subunit